jgi:Fanconi anemia group M protein
VSALESVPKIFADHREGRSRIAEMMREKGAEVQVAQLPVGDFVVSERAAVERKRREDFERSIVDGRLFSQAQALKEAFETPVLVVEGERFGERVSRQAVLGAVASLMLDFGISVFFTRDADKTAEFVVALARREQLGSRKPMRVMPRRKALSLCERQRAVVESLPGVGPKLARALLEEFGSVGAVMRGGEKRMASVGRMGEARAKAVRALIDAEFAEEEGGGECGNRGRGAGD